MNATAHRNIGSMSCFPG